MEVVKNRNDLNRLHNQINDELFASITLDVKMIEEYFDSQSDEYGPLVIIINENEQEKMEEKYPIIKKIEPEDYVSIFEDENIKIERTCYILTDAGFIVYVTRKKA